MKKDTLNCCKDVNEGKTLCWFKFSDKAALRNVESEMLLDIPPDLLLWSWSVVLAGKDVFKVEEPACKACNLGCWPTAPTRGIGRCTDPEEVLVIGRDEGEGMSSI